MSWDLVLFRFKGTPPRDLDSMDENQMAPLGTARAVRDAVSRFLPETDWSDPSWGFYSAENFTVEFNAGSGEIIETMMLHIRGDGDDAGALVMRFAQPNNWAVFDCSSGEFLDPGEISRNGWEGFKAFRDSLLKT